MRFTVLLRLLSSLSVLCGCASSTTYPSRKPQSSILIPSDEEVFLKGLFQFKKDPKQPTAEDHFHEPLDLSQRRPVFDLQGTVFFSKYGKAGYKLFANVYHHGHFYLARIPEDGVTHAFMGLTYFADPISGETQFVRPYLRFDFRPGRVVELVAEMPDLAGLERLRTLHPEQIFEEMPTALKGGDFELKSLAVSFDPQWTAQDATKNFDPLRIARGAYIQISRVTSMETQAEDFFITGNPVLVAPLSSVDAGNLFFTALKQSQELGLGRLYPQLKSRCAMQAFDLLTPASRQIRLLQSQMHLRHPAEESALKSMYTDPVLEGDVRTAYETVILKAGRDVCPLPFSKGICQNIQRTVKRLHLPEPRSA